MCQFWNTPEGRFYGELWNGEIVDISEKPSSNWRIPSTKYTIKRDSGLPNVDLQRKEIRRRL